MPQFYAFVEPNNPHDTYALPADLGGQRLTLVFTSRGSLASGSAAAAREAQPDAGARARELLSALEAEAARLPSTLVDDERALRASHLLAPRAALATAFRAEKKRLLQRCLDRASRRAAAQGGGG